MPSTALDAETALVVIDLQNWFRHVPTVHPAATVLASAGRLAAAFRAAKRPVVLVSVAFSADDADRLKPRADAAPRALPSDPEMLAYAPELGASPGDLRITKRQWNAFYGTELDLQLRRRRVTGIVLAGVATSIGVDTTARGAYERGYNVTFATDAMTDLDAAAHEHGVAKMFPRMGEVDTTDEILRHVPR